MKLAEINVFDREGFVATLGWVFEHSPWVAEKAWLKRPFKDVKTLHAQMAQVVAEAEEGEQLALLRAHPDLGARARMSDASEGEQAGAGLDRLSPEMFARLQKLNSAYRERFGFPFIYAVKGSSAAQILDALEQGLKADPAVERGTALEQIERIAWFRLSEVVE